MFKVIFLMCSINHSVSDVHVQYAYDDNGSRVILSSYVKASEWASNSKFLKECDGFKILKEGE